MSNSEKLSTILDLCIRIDQTAVELYTSLSAFAGNDALKGFWDKMAAEGLSHLEYWQKLKTLAAYDELPEAFDKPEQVISELQERAEQIQALQTQWEKDRTVSSAFVIAYRLESYKLHPALRTLFQYFRPITDGKLPEDKELDETNISAFVAALRKYGEVDAGTGTGWRDFAAFVGPEQDPFATGADRPSLEFAQPARIFHDGPAMGASVEAEWQSHFDLAGGNRQFQDHQRIARPAKGGRNHHGCWQKTEVNFKTIGFDRSLWRG